MHEVMFLEIDENETFHFAIQKVLFAKDAGKLLDHLGIESERMVLGNNWRMIANAWKYYRTRRDQWYSHHCTGDWHIAEESYHDAEVAFVLFKTMVRQSLGLPVEDYDCDYDGDEFL